MQISHRSLLAFSRLSLYNRCFHSIEQLFDSSAWAILSPVEVWWSLLERTLANSLVRHVRQWVTGVELTGDGWTARTAAAATVDYLVGVG